MRVRMHGFGLGVLLVVATSSPALAQQPPSTAANTGPAKTEYPPCTRTIQPSESEAAHAKYLAGKVDYDEAKYESALQNFKTAYEKDCSKHELLVIISRAHELNQNLPEAIKALETYLERAPNAADAPAHKTRIEKMKEKLADERKKQAAAAEAAAKNPPPEQSVHTVYPWIVVGAGVLAATIGVTLLIAKPDTGCDLDTQKCVRDTGESDEAYKKRQADAGRERGWSIAGPILIGGGAALVAGGLIWYFLEPSLNAKDPARAKLTPQLGPGFGGLAFTGRF